MSSHRTSLRLSTAKSALLIYFTLLGLSPILKSLTRSTSSDSIWAMSFCLFAINIFFFDYGTPSSSPSPSPSVPPASMTASPSTLAATTNTTNTTSAPAVNTPTTSTAPTTSTSPLSHPPSPSLSSPAPSPPSTSSALTNKHIPASLSTNAALMASTVLASRLPRTSQVFSLTLVSIEVFGLFPVFRRYAREHSHRANLALTAALVCGAGGGVGLILGANNSNSPIANSHSLAQTLADAHTHASNLAGGNASLIMSGIAAVGTEAFPWKSGLMGLVLGVVITVLAMGACSWWLIGLQKYKNEIHGPWDPARPIIRRRWDDF